MTTEYSPDTLPGSPPHTRGGQLPDDLDHPRKGLTPAYAGRTLVDLRVHRSIARFAFTSLSMTPPPASEPEGDASAVEVGNADALRVVQREIVTEQPLRSMSCGHRAVT